MEFAPVRVMSPVWARGRAWVEDGEIVLDESRAIEYGFGTPEESERMAFDLAALPWMDEKAAVSFAGRWGLLWHGADDLGTGECREPLQDWWVEAGRLNLVGALYQAIQDSTRDGIREGSAKPVQDLIRRAGGSGFPSVQPGSEHFDRDYITGASVTLQSMINDGLNAGANEIPPSPKGKRRCWWGLETVGPGELRLAQYPPDLLSRAYSAFALLTANKGKTRPCAVCGKLFRPKTRRSEACDDHVNTLRSQRNREKSRAG